MLQKAGAAPAKDNTVQELKQQVRVLLSWREQAERLKKPVTQAENQFLRLREREAPRMREMGATLQMLLRRQKQTTGNVESEHISKQIIALQGQIAYQNHLLSKATLEDVGGFLDLPLEKYPKLLKKEKRALWTAWTAREKKQAALIALSLVVAVLGVLSFTLWGGQVSFEAEAPDYPKGQLRLVCHNNTHKAIRLSAPRSASAGNKGTKSSFGVAIFVKEPGKSSFKLVTGPSAWYYNGDPTTQRGPIMVGPGLSAELELDLPKALPAGVEADAFRVSCIRGDGKTVYTFTQGNGL